MVNVETHRLEKIEVMNKLGAMYADGSVPLDQLKAEKNKMLQSAGVPLRYQANLKDVVGNERAMNIASAEPTPAANVKPEAISATTSAGVQQDVIPDSMFDALWS